MKIIKKFSPNEKDLKESSVPSRPIRDFPSITKEDNPEVLTGYLAAYAKESEDASQRAAVALARKKKVAKSEATNYDSVQKVAKSEATNYDSVQKVAKSEATNYDCVAASNPKRKRGKRDSSITQEAVKLALEKIEAGEERPSKRQSGVDIVSPMFFLTPEMAKRSKEYSYEPMAEKKRKAAQYKLERDEQLKAMGQENCDQFFVEKLAEVQEIASKVDEEAVKGAKEILKKAQGTPEAGASGSVPKSTVSEAAASEVPQSPKVDQISDPQTTITPSSSADSDLDNIPLSQKYNLSKLTPKSKPSPKSKLSPKTKPFKPVYPVILKSIGELSQRRVDLCYRLPADHPLQPPIIKPLNLIPAGETIPCSSLSNQSPTRVNSEVVGSTSVVETLADPEEPSSADLPHSNSPSNQQPTSSQQNKPEQTTITKTQEKTIPKSVMETVVEESVPMIESETSVSIPNSEPTQNLNPSASDHPSSSSQIQILDQPPVNILKSDYLEDQLVELHEEMQTLLLLRRIPTLSVAYEDQWASVKSKACDIIDVVAKKCCRIQAVAQKRHLNNLHSSELSKSKLMYLANAPFYAESEYVSRETKEFKMLKQKVMRQQEESKAREEYLLQRQLALEETVKKQFEDIKRLMALIQQQQLQPNP